MYRRQCVCRVASAALESCHPTSRQHEIQTAKDEGTCSVSRMDHKHCSTIRFNHQYPSCGIQTSITKFCFENNKPAEVCDEWYGAVQYLKSMVNNIEVSLNELGISYLEEMDGLKWNARPYHYTTDDIVDIRRLHSPDESVYSRSTVYDETPSEKCAEMSQQYCEQSTVATDVSSDRFHAPHVSKVGTSLDGFFTSTASAVCDLVQFRCSCSVCRDLLRHGRPDELLPYLDEKTFYSGLLSRRDRSHNSFVLHCDNVSRQLVMDSFGLLRLESSQDPQLLYAGTASSLTPGGNDDKQKLPNIDQLRAIQDNLAYNVCT